MGPLTLVEKYGDVVRCADQPLSPYDKLSNEDFDEFLAQTDFKNVKSSIF